MLRSLGLVLRNVCFTFLLCKIQELSYIWKYESCWRMNHTGRTNKRCTTQRHGFYYVLFSAHIATVQTFPGNQFLQDSFITFFLVHLKKIFHQFLGSLVRALCTNKITAKTVLPIFCNDAFLHPMLLSINGLSLQSQFTHDNTTKFTLLLQ